MRLQCAQAHWRLEKCQLVIFQSLAAQCLSTCASYSLFLADRSDLLILYPICVKVQCDKCFKNLFCFSVFLNGGYLSYCCLPFCQLKPVCSFFTDLSYEHCIATCCSLEYSFTQSLIDWLMNLFVRPFVRFISFCVYSRDCCACKPQEISSFMRHQQPCYS